MSEIYRAIRFPVDRSSVEWSEFCGLLVESLRRSTRIANTAIQLLFRNDFSPVEVGIALEKHSRSLAYQRKSKPGSKGGRQAKKKKQDKWFTYPTEINLYSEIRRLAPDFDTQSVATITRRIRGDYMKKRAGFLLSMTQRFPYYQFPFPVIVPPKDYSISIVPAAQNGKDDDQFKVELKLGRVNDRPRWVSLYTTVKKTHSYQAQAIKAALKENKRFGSMQIELVPANKGDHRPCIQMRDQHRNRVYYRVQVSVPIPFVPKVKAERPEKVIIIHTSPEHFLVARSAKSVVWRLNEDRVAQRIGYLNAETAVRKTKDFDRRQQRLREDMKFHRQSGVRSGLRVSLRRTSEERKNWQNSWLSEVVSRVFDYVDRNHITSVLYYDDDGAKNNLATETQAVDKWRFHFPWYSLKQKLANACEINGIEFQAISVEGSSFPTTEEEWQKEITRAKAVQTKKQNKQEDYERSRRTQVVAGI